MSKQLVIALAIAAPGCAEEPATGTVAAAGMLNGMLNGFHHPEGLTRYLADTCPVLGARLLGSGDLTESFPAQVTAELARPACRDFMFYTAELMVPHGDSLTLHAEGVPVATFAGALDMQHLVAQAYPGYVFAQHSFAPVFPIARIVVTQGYAALTNGIERTVSYKTHVPELDAQRDADEDDWPREFTQLVPFTAPAFAAMQSDPAFRARLPNFFEACDPLQTNYDYLAAAERCLESTSFALCHTDDLPPADGYCPVPVVVHGNLSYVDDVVPGRSCRILGDGEQPPPGSSVVGDVAVPPGGCPLIYYRGRIPGVRIYDDRAYNPFSAGNDGCDKIGPSNLTNCDFDVVVGGTPIPDAFLDYYVYNLRPI